MEEKKEYIERRPLLDKAYDADYYERGQNRYMVVNELDVLDAPTAEVVEISELKRVKEELLQTIDEFIAEYRHISKSYVDHFGGKVDAMETAKRLVDNALTNLIGEDDD